MYNEEVKNKFLNHQKNVNKFTEGYLEYLTCLFGNLSVTEEEYEKDIYEMSYPELLEAINHSSGKTISTNRTMISAVRSYVEYCISAGIKKDPVNLLDFITPASVDYRYKIYKKMWKDFDDLKDYVNIVFEDLSACTRDNFVRMIIYLLFDGVPPKVIFLAKKTDYNNGVLTFEDTEYKLSKETSTVVEFCLQMTHIITNNNSVMLPYTPYLARNSRSKHGKSLMKSIYVMLSTCNKDYKEKTKRERAMNISQIYLSGIFYRMYKKEELGLTVDFSECIQLNKNKEIEAEYKNWKETFYYE